MQAQQQQFAASARRHRMPARETQPVRPLPHADDPLWTLGKDVVQMLVSYLDDMTEAGY